MADYLSYQFVDSEEFVYTFDELPLWSAPFGLLLLKHVDLKPNLTVLDIGSGAGFPLLELAGRLGASSKLYGLDPWTNANKRARQKIINYQLSNVEIVENSAEQIPFADNYFDLIVSNLGINNFDKPQAVLNECFRVLQTSGKLILTTNLHGHWQEFYTIFESTLKQIGKEKFVKPLIEHQEHRGTVESVTKLFTECGLKVCRYYEEIFEMKFLDGSAFLNHYFVKLGWLTTWIGLFPKSDLKEIFSALERNLNIYSNASNGLTLTVPMLYIEGEKAGRR
ncbi:MAG: class I SAM-dependent methyltransferase [Bacteroidota bacterium]|nr:class I SAM-dependent methyltransferase [Bacteroidota bacterium]